MKKQKEPQKKRRQEKNRSFSVGDLIKVAGSVAFLDESMLGTVGMIVSYHETGYPKGISGRSNDSIMYTVAANGKNIKLFEDEMEIIQ